VVLNKMDLVPKDSPRLGALTEAVRVSALTGDGMEELKERIAALVWGGKGGPEMFEVMINSRHQTALLRALESTQRTIAALESKLSIELAAFDLRLAVQAIGEIVGKTTTEDLLDSIFSQFCLGK
jgi:tRNA modification GTPase